MSISPSSEPISRWSRGSKSNRGRSPTSRMTTASSSVSPSGASGSGRLGRARASSPSFASTPSSSSLPLSIFFFSSPTVAISSSAPASSPAPLRSPICFESVFRSAWALSTSGSSSRRRASRASSSSTCSAAPRRANAALNRSGSERIAFRSSMVRTALGSFGFAGTRRLFGFGARVLGDELRDFLGLFADDDVLGHDRPGEAAVLDREEGVVVGLGSRWFRFGPWVRSPRLPVPWVPAALSVWQPEQWVAKRTAPL